MGACSHDRPHASFFRCAQARALWLVGACGQDLPLQDWCNAYKLVVAHMASVDVVVRACGAFCEHAALAQVVDKVVRACDAFCVHAVLAQVVFTVVLACGVRGVWLGRERGGWGD